MLKKVGRLRGFISPEFAVHLRREWRGAWFVGVGVATSFAEHILAMVIASGA
jgi:hypothetical protein